MAITLQMRTDISQLYVALFGRAPDSEGLGFWVEALGNGSSLTAIADSMYATAPARAYFPTYMTNQEIVASFYLNVLGRPADAEGLAFWTAALNGSTKGEVISQMIANVTSWTPSGNAVLDAAGQLSKDLYINKVAVAQYYAENSGTIAGATVILSGVTADATTVAAAKAIVAGGPADGNAFTSLTTGLDTLTGTASADTFTARVVQNSLGEQTNQLATGDQIHAGAGNDTLNAVVQAASALNAGPASGIMITSTGLENALFTALDVNDNTAAGNADSASVTINAKDMRALDKVGSVQSDASLVIQNLTTLTDTGAYADRRNTESVTVRMDHSGNDKAVDAESDLTVLFDNDYLLAGKSSSDNAYYFLEDREGAALNAAKPLAHIQNDGIKFTVAGVTKTITITPAQLATFQATDGTWAGYTALLKGALAAAAVTDKSLVGLDLNLSTTVFRTQGLDGTTLPVKAPAIVLSSATSAVDALGFTTSPDSVGQYDVFAVTSNEEPTTLVDLVTVNVELYKAGRGSDGGDLTIGGMATDMANKWDFTKSALKEGVERFNISVEGDATQFSSLASLQSTNNTLREVNVVSKTTLGQVSIAGLEIGNHNTVGGTTNALKDVQTFNAAEFKGDLTLNASVTTESIAKYLNLKDGAPALPVADNKAFVYTGGAGNDKLNVVIDAAVAGATSTLTGQSDFTFAVNGGAGNDNITVKIGGDNTPAWYVDQKLNANVFINGGEGNDTIRTLGAGDFRIDAGAGNDTVYLDNSGSTNSTWIISAANTNLSDLQAVPANNASTFLYNGKLTVTFSGAQMAAAGGVTSADAAVLTNGFEVQVAVPTGSNYAVNQLNINQAIKAAINLDPALSKLLVATDGPGNTLTVKSLIDGTFVENDLLVSVSGADLTTLPAGEQATALAAYKTFSNNSAATIANAQAAQVATVTADNAVNGMDVNQVLNATGTASLVASDNTINLGAGNDVLVLGTGVDSNDTIAFSGYELGSKTIVNYTVGGTAGDTLNFGAYLNNQSSASGSVESAIKIAQTANTDAVVEANSVTVLKGTFSATNTFADLTAAKLLAAVNSTNVGTADYAGLTAATLDAATSYTATGASTTLVGGVGKAVVMVENNLNLGQYAMYELSFNGTSANTKSDFTDAKLISTVDFGNTLVAGGGVPGATYTVAPTAGVTSVDEGTIASFDVATTGLADGTYAYTLGGTVSADDVTGGLTGDVIITNGVGTISVDLIADATTEDVETLTASIGGITSAEVTVNDTSVTAAAPGDIVLTPGTIDPVAATAAADVFKFDVAAAQALAANTQISVTGFDLVADLLTIDTVTAMGATTLDMLNGVDGITVQTNGITNETLINFGPDADGDVIAVTLTGVSDAALVNINVI